MENYRVLLVDDEEQIRLGISHTINWEKLGFTLIEEAENGLEALEICEAKKPDVVLTDIKMPFMDGLELCRHLRQTLPAAKVIVFSGFDDFEFARQALSSGVFEYIMKPINAEELSDVLIRLRKSLDDERMQKRDMEVLRKQYEESLPVLRELFFTRLLDGKITDEEILQKAARYELDVSKDNWTVVLIRAGIKGQSSSDELLLLSVRNFIDNHLQLDVIKAFYSTLYNDGLALLINAEQIYPLINEIQRICALIQTYLGINACAGIGRVQNISSINHSANEAKQALEHQMMMGETAVIYIGDIQQFGTVKLSFGEHDFNALENAVKLANIEKIQEFVTSLMDRVKKSQASLVQCQMFFLEIIAALVKIARISGEQIETEFSKYNKDFISVAQSASFDDVSDGLIKCCANLSELMSKTRTDSTYKAIERAKEFILHHYSESELSVDTLCEYLHVSSTYFSTLFKKETGKSFIAYVTELRMEKAANMLEHTDEKTYIIAEKSGYTDPNYFSYVFKRHFGVTPSKYRAGQRK